VFINILSNSPLAHNVALINNWDHITSVVGFKCHDKTSIQYCFTIKLKLWIGQYVQKRVYNGMAPYWHYLCNNILATFFFSLQTKYERPSCTIVNSRCILLYLIVSVTVCQDCPFINIKVWLFLLNCGSPVFLNVT